VQVAPGPGAEPGRGDLPVFPGADGAEPVAAVRAPAQPRHADGHLPERPMSATPSLARRFCLAFLGASALTIMTVGSLLALAVAVPTLFRARRLYREVIARWTARLVLGVCRIKVVVHHDGLLPETQTVYVSNHSSVVDFFVLTALGPPNARFFL